MFGHRGIDEDGLRRIMTNVRRARDEAELRSQQAPMFAIRARERAQHSTSAATATAPRAGRVG